MTEESSFHMGTIPKSGSICAAVTDSDTEVSSNVMSIPAGHGGMMFKDGITQAELGTLLDQLEEVLTRPEDFSDQMFDVLKSGRLEILYRLDQ